jgi:lysozyme family protein
MSILAAGFSVIPLYAQSSGTIRDAQQVLKDKGFYDGAVDGIYGPKTRAAVRSYQEKQSLAADGRLGPQTLDSLGVKHEGAATEFHEAGTEVKNSYTKGGKEVGQGGKEFGKEVAHGHVVEGSKDLGKDVGKGAKKIGEGTGHAVVNSAKGVKNGVTGDHSKDTNPHQ